MDATKGERIMAADMLSVGEQQFCNNLVGIEGVQEAWVAGGSLMRTESKDVDIIVLMDEELTVDDLPDFEFDGYCLEVVHKNYSGDTDDNVDFVIKLYSEKGDRPIDLLVVSSRSFDKIELYMMTHFPVTAQMIAVNVATGVETNRTSVPLGEKPRYITINNRYPAYSAYAAKYMKYYPDAVFMHRGKHVPHYKWTPAGAVANGEATKDAPF